MVIVHWKEDCIPSMNLGKEKKYELFGEYEQTFSAFVFCLLYLHMNISTHVVKFRHGCFSCDIFLPSYRKSTQTQGRDLETEKPESLWARALHKGI